ncbi:MAG TPA: UbiA-like polyprenyltransferase [Planctomycetota bacterium]|nr:UbiA-like polyprenyltransferase [Planctomycetota bacterium]
MSGALRRILADIKLAHSVFALPFALLGLLLGLHGRPPTLRLALQVLAAMVLARSAAMGWNRLADRRFDASNPRTAARALPAGAVSPRAMALFVLACAAGFVAVAASISRLCLLLAPLVLAVLWLYSLTKRFTALAHLFVGLALALSPPAAYVAARGSIDADIAPVLWLGLAVLLWVAGFDVIYACQDVEHDRREGLCSLPARMGIGPALGMARLLHAGMLAALLVAARLAGLGPLSWAAIGLVAALLVVEHGLVRGGNLARVNAAFFTLNGAVSLLFGLLVAADLLWR